MSSKGLTEHGKPSDACPRLLAAGDSSGTREPPPLAPVPTVPLVPDPGAAPVCRAPAESCLGHAQTCGAPPYPGADDGVKLLNAAIPSSVLWKRSQIPLVLKTGALTVSARAAACRASDLVRWHGVEGSRCNDFGS